MLNDKNLRELIIGKYYSHAYGKDNDLSDEAVKKSVAFADDLMKFLKENGNLEK